MQKPELSEKRIFPYVVPIGLVLITTLLGEFVKRSLEPTNLAMFYLLVVVIAAVQYGKGPAIITSILSVLSFDFFLVPPYLTFNVASIHYIFTFIGLLVVGLVVSTLASRMREQTIQAQRREAQTVALYRLSDDLADSDTFGTALRVIRKNVGHIFNCDVAIFSPAGGILELNSYDPDFPVNEHEKEMAAWAFENAKPVGGSSDNSHAEKTRYIPFKTLHGVLGVLGIRFRKNRDDLTSGEENLLNALISQAAMAIQRAKLTEESRQIELMRQTEKLHSALLSSISHDLRTPLVSITGTLATLLGDNPRLDDSTRKELLENASEDADRLNQLVGNLLDMTRMEAQALRISKEPCELRDVLGASLEQLKGKIGSRNIRITIPRDFPEVPLDFSFMMKVFHNVIDNALKYSPHDAPIEIKAQMIQDKAQIEITDHGAGIPGADLERIFEKFYRAEKPRQVTGTGLGLSICKGIIEAHGGEIIAKNNPDKGATFIIALPLH